MGSLFPQLSLPVFFCLHLEGILQPVQQLVGELTNILLLSEAQIKSKQIKVQKTNNMEVIQINVIYHLRALWM